MDHHVIAKKPLVTPAPPTDSERGTDSRSVQAIQDAKQVALRTAATESGREEEHWERATLLHT
jgi:hypothetical protein